MTVPTTAREYRLKLGSYNNLSIGEKTVETPKAYEVLVKIHAVSLQFRDLSIANRTYLASSPDNNVPCSDMAGEIVALGEGVTDLKVGDRVCANFTMDHIYGDISPGMQQSSLGGQTPGVLTEYRTFPAHAMIKFPAFLSYEQASTLPCAALTAYNALYGPRPIKAGDYVLIMGTGGVSIFALQMAVACGAIVIAISSSDDKLAFSKKLGAKHVINYRNVSEWDKEILKITEGVGVDHVLEVGGYGTLTKSMNAVKMGGYIHLIGLISNEQHTGNIIATAIMKAIILRGIYVGSASQFKDMNRLIEAHPSLTTPIIDKVFPFEEAIEAYAYLESQKHVGKVVIKVA